MKEISYLMVAIIRNSKCTVLNNDMIKTALLIIMICLLSGCSFSGSDNATEQAPNILIITVDNLGYGDLHIYNGDSPAKTPNIDRLASQGARLTSFYTASPTCTASRAALLSGRIPQRYNLDYQLIGVEQNYGIGLHHSEILIPEIIKRSSPHYATGAFGKWNIGFAPGSRPTDRGFDEFLGNVSGNIDYYAHVYKGKHDLYKNTEEIYRTGDYSSDLFANAAIDFIREKSNNADPWFVYLPFNAPHFPSVKNKAPGQANIWQAPDWAFAKVYGLSPDEPDPQKRYHAVLTALDHAIGNVLEVLDSLGIDDNTFVFLFSDNGAFRLDRPIDIGINDPLREGGVTCWEGGLRVPAFVRWPGKIKANSVIGTPLWSPDILVASAMLAEAELPTDLVLDGKDPLPVLTGKTNVSPHEFFFFQFEEHAALRQGDWKIVRTKPDQPWQLYNVEKDISESENKASEMPDLVEKLNANFLLKQEEIQSSHQHEAGQGS
jgi:arylsulfatase A-like enzyme